jgi:NHLM bacteriocin system ABC transporter peptidase/ATP-binding protein
VTDAPLAAPASEPPSFASRLVRRLTEPFREATGAIGRVAPVPLILQMDAAECGAASLAMVLARYGRWVPLEQLRLACGVSRDGSKATNILKAARSFGMNAKGFRKEPNQLGDIGVPAIVHWNFNHFLVLEGIRGKTVSLADPARGRMTVSLSDFNESFTGVVLALAPGPEFTRGGPRPQPFKQLMSQLRSSWVAAVLVGLFSLLLVIPGLAVPGLSKLFVDKVMLQGFHNWILPLCGGLIFANIFQAAVTWLQQYYLLRIEAKLAVVMSSRVISRLMDQSLAFLGQRFAGELAGRVGAADSIAQLLSGQVATTGFNLVAVLIYGGAMAMFDPAVAAVAFAVPVVNITMMRMLRKRMQDLNRRVALDRGKLMGRTAAVLSGIETIKVSGAEGDAFAQWAGQHARTLGSIQSLSVRNSVVGAVPGLLSAIGTAAVIGFGGLRVIEGQLSLGSLLAIQTLLASFIGPLNGVMGLFEQIQHAQGDLNRLADLMARPEKELLATASAPVTARSPVPDAAILLTGRIELRKLSFGYSRTDPPLIDDFSLTLEPGMRVALVGGSGSGKSTVGRMIAGLLDPWSGEVLFDGMERQDIPPRGFASSVSYVDQDVFLFEGTIRDNLTLWDTTVPEANIADALKDAEIHHEVVSRQGGYEAHVSEGGLNFSGGQRQRLEIARALVPNPAVLILDEATAALDPITEQKIDQAVRRRGCTCIIIAHRLSAIRDADEIIVLRRGKIVERGNHDQLVAAGNIYAGLIKAEV